MSVARGCRSGRAPLNATTVTCSLNQSSNPVLPCLARMASAMRWPARASYAAAMRVVPGVFPGTRSKTPSCSRARTRLFPRTLLIAEATPKSRHVEAAGVDALTAENYPYLVRHCLARGCEIIGHGMSVSRMITSDMSQKEEEEYIDESLSALTLAIGHRPVGWLGPEQGESFRTPQLLAQAGVRYVCDWPNDEQPYPIKTTEGELFALPLMFELDDVIALAQRRVAVDRYAKMLKEGFDVMYQDGEQNVRVLGLNLHPWLIGQPFRIGFLDEALGHMMRRQGVWAASGVEIIDWYKGCRSGN